MHAHNNYYYVTIYHSCLMQTSFYICLLESTAGLTQALYNTHTGPTVKLGFSLYVSVEIFILSSSTSCLLRASGDSTWMLHTLRE